MGRKRSISSVLDDENPTTTSSPRVTIRSIVQPRNQVINEELSEILEDSEIQDNELSEVLENTEDINDESFQLRTLNEQKVNKDQQVNLLPQKHIISRYISTSDNIGQDNISNGDNESENNNSDEDDELNGDNESENNNSEFFEDYSYPSFEPFQEPNIA
ncbi:hypothetical protein C1646_774000 [Rhizophagus diaphanus]|nr:hypothetical protein C1646_774000 [Rhizophagus diaphanus] [Rhizophagus sp. MUCL 43196]